MREPIKSTFNIKFVLKITVCQPRSIDKNDLLKGISLGSRCLQSQVFEKTRKGFLLLLEVDEILQKWHNFGCIETIKFLFLLPMHDQVDFNGFNRYFRFLNIFLGVPVDEGALSS
jgi:hypothetical protein